MHLKELLADLQYKPESSVPEWVLGCFKRRSISFASGLTDAQTHVFWLQSRNITIDLRLPIESEQVVAKDLAAYDASDLHRLANYEGWYAESAWDNNALSWSGGVSFQVHNRWPEPALLHRVGDCMIEFAPSSIYVEDWRLLSRRAGPLIGLRLIEEVNIDSGEITHRDGALIINGDWAGLVLGRSQPLDVMDNQSQLRELVASHQQDLGFLKRVFNFETSVAQGDLDKGYAIAFSNSPGRVGEDIFSLEGFDYDPTSKELHHSFEQEGASIRRRFTLDTVESTFPFTAETGVTEAAAQWFEREQETLGRYLRKI